MGTVHIAVTLQVRPGSEQEFEAKLCEFARESLHEPGVTGVHLIEPVPGTAGREYGVLRSFASTEASEAFYKSERFRRWEEDVASLVVGPAIRRPLTGLEAFFRDTHFVPPRWKMAVVTWLGVFPSVALWSSVLQPVLKSWPHLLMVAVMNVCVVVTLAWGVMPLLTRWFRPWLHARPFSQNQ